MLTNLSHRNAGVVITDILSCLGLWLQYSPPHNYGSVYLECTQLRVQWLFLVLCIGGDNGCTAAQCAELLLQVEAYIPARSTVRVHLVCVDGPGQWNTCAGWKGLSGSVVFSLWHMRNVYVSHYIFYQCVCLSVPSQASYISHLRVIYHKVPYDIFLFLPSGFG